MFWVHPKLNVAPLSSTYIRNDHHNNSELEIVIRKQSRLRSRLTLMLEMVKNIVYIKVNYYISLVTRFCL